MTNQSDNLSESDRAILEGLKNPDAPKGGKSLKQDAGTEILACFLTNSLFAAKHKDTIQPRWLHSFEHQRICAAALEYWREHDTAPTCEALTHMIGEKLKGSPRVEQVTDEVHNLFHYPIKDRDYWQKYFERWAREEQERILLTQLLDYKEKRQSDKAIEIIGKLAEHYTPVKTEEKKQFYFRDDIFALPDQQWIVEDWIPADAICAVIGEPGACKSFFAQHLANSVVTGEKFLGQSTMLGSVVYMTLEGKSGIKPRWRAWEQFFNCSIPADKLAYGFQEYCLCELAEGRRLLQDIRRLQLPDLRLVVIDTLNKYIGGNENEASDMSGFVRSCNLLRQELNCCVLVVHHTGKDLSKGERGHSSFRGGCDTILQVDRNILNCTKQKDSAIFSEVFFSKTEVEFGDAEQDRSLVLKRAFAESAERVKTRDDLFCELFSAGADVKDVEYEQVVGISRSTAFKWAKRLANCGRLKRLAEGEYILLP